MVFEVNGKVALITGGASGIGLEYAKELLRNGVKGVTLADINENFGQNALSEIEAEFGPKAIFVKTDVTIIQQFEDAFKKTIETFHNIDILINNAGILNDAIWEKEISINMNGVVHGMLLALDNYLQKFRQDSEGVIVNISSIGAIEVSSTFPIYCGIKLAVLGMTMAWGHSFHYDRTKVRVVAICPGLTSTPMTSEMRGKTLGEQYENKGLRENYKNAVSQTPNHVAKEVVKIIKAAENGTAWIIEGGEGAYEFSFPERENIARKYIDA